ncbi:hypothetical protein VN24_03475 [Paenibacillus beijingensis]|uniref:Uncharacterized protein n=1 Tax=Paenibacillus beijingensis TaxID=1126833 RepID=A0A0D5NR29_9BACL|nr:hypothetical protein VN24_03475 [Paenibacillus beijingensis]
MAEAIKLHNDGVAGNQNAVQQANRVLAQLRKDYPGHPIADAFHGSVMALIARDESNPIERLQLARGGLKLLDGAVAADPQDRTIRMLRGNVAYQLPETFFHRTETAIEDYLVLINGELRNPGSLEKETYAKLVYELGDAFHRINRQQEAKLCWRRLVQEKDSKYSRLAMQRLGLKADSAGQETNGESDLSELTADKTLGLYDWLGALVCIAGVSIVLWMNQRK